MVANQVPEPPDRSPREEAANRAATGAGLHTAAAAVGLADHKRLLDQHARNAERSWKMGMKAMGFADNEIDQEIQEGDEMGGDVSVAGDTHIHIVPTPANESPAPQVSPPQAQKASGSKILPWVIAAGLSGLGGGALMSGVLKSETPKMPIDTTVVVQPAGSDSTERTTIGLSTGPVSP